MNRILLIISITTFMFVLSACDPLHKDKCEWYLDPEPKHRDLITPGWVSVCARNFEINRQKCYLKMRFDMAKKVFNKPFKLSDLVLKEDVFPREVLSVTLCSPR